MAPAATTAGERPTIETGVLENLLLRDDNIYETSLNSEDYLNSLAPIIKDAVKSNGLSDLIYKLNDIVSEKDEELAELSLSSTKDINSCIDTIDEIHTDARGMSESLVDVSRSLNDSVVDLVVRKKKYIRAKEVSNKIQETSVVLNLCIQVLESTNRIHDLIKQHKYFSALKLIDELKNIHLPKVENFSFSLKIYDSIPHLTNMIKEESFDNLNKWLSMNLERRLIEVGNRLYDNLHILQTNWEAEREKNPTFKSHKLNSPVEVVSRDPLTNLNILNDANLVIDLSTIFDSILVYLTMNEEEELQALYHKEWMKRYNRVIYPITSATAQSIAEFQDINTLDHYLRKIAALFVLDRQINLSTKYQLRTQANSNDLWDSYVAKLKPVLARFIETQLHGFSEFESVKNLIGNFMQIMENNGFRINDLYDILMSLFRNQLTPELIQDFRSEFLEAIQSDHYMPLVINNQDDYDRIMKICWYKPDQYFAPSKITRMPVSLPFSEDYVHFCLGIRSLLDDILHFTRMHYGMEITELNSIIVNEIFERILGSEKGYGICNDMRAFIEKNASNKEIVAQSYTNLEYYLYSLFEIGKLINRRLRVNMGLGVHGNDNVYTLRAVDEFKRLREFAEQTIFAMVDGKISELLDMVELDDWLPTVKNSESNYSIKDFAMFLENLFTSIFATLPVAVKTIGLIRTYDSVAQHFVNVLKDVPRFNRIGIENFDLDIKYLESSMQQLDTTQSDSDVLTKTFDELRQCIDLLLLEDYEEYKRNPDFRARFDRIRADEGFKLISKMHSGEESPQFDVNTPLEEVRSQTPNQMGDNQSLFSNTTSSRFAKFSSRFNKAN
ncbi:uncharacterized protein KQ657_001091 [Scheffersomyces spartinae]|uniref:Exocyst complex component SEC15 n=1 Tax=Scheffersomyces spartinae TaxID=45513 RepID=A0A9P7V7V2_9ASCO|nr:uncharacterized protein KQ657_001091 [Scheffersomyces spartinae]KAG7192981.1 hypothetical protein KQ657_001091 [Scheffersomyces spartinae]